MKYNNIHLIGIGGISMSGIAKMLLNKGFKVSGSDINKSDLLLELEEMGAQIFNDHSKDNVTGADLVVVSSAIPEKNVELQYARKLGIKIYKRAEMIAELMKNKKGIAISGTHGKTTTTAMISLVLKKAEFDPAILLGGKLDLLQGNACTGHGDYFITEADESDGSLLYLNPEISVITNIELDHHDYYENTEQVISIFEEFCSKTINKGFCLLNADNANIQQLINRFSEEKISTFGLKKGELQATNITLLPFGSLFTVNYQGKDLGEINLQVPGYHNIKNALACIGTCLHLNVNFVEIKTYLEEFRGVKRRFEKKGLIEDVLIIDDYAHHPTEIKETLKAAKNTGYERIVAIFQPHRFTRTKHLLKDFSRSFAQVDYLIVTPIYGAGETPIKGVSSQKLVDLIKENTIIKVKYVENFTGILSHLNKIVKSRDLILTLGAGDIYKVGEEFIEMNK